MTRLFSFLCVVGEGEYGEHDIVEQAEQYLQASHQHPLNYNPPTVNVVFYGGVTKAIVGEFGLVSALTTGYESNEHKMEIKW